MSLIELLKQRAFLKKALTVNPKSPLLEARLDATEQKIIKKMKEKPCKS